MNRTNSPTTKNSDLIELTIDSLSYNGGRGVGRYDGLVVFVPWTAPQDRVHVRVTNKKPRFWEGEVVEILEPSPLRREPPCPVFGRCGGCTWQHVGYPEQALQKENILASSLRALAKYGGFERLPLLRAEEEFYYRNRIQVQVIGGRYGFFARGSNDLVEVDHCWISESAINQKLKTLGEDIKTSPAKRIEIAVTESGETVLMRDQRDPEAALFSQVNTHQNIKMKGAMVDLVRIDPDWIMDLYSGSGNLASSLFEKFPDKPFDAVEFSSVATERGRKKLPKVRWHAEDVEKFLKRAKPATGSGLVVLDPPRPGVSDAVVQELKRLRPKQILYISCNPATFARDAERLVQDGAYRLETVQGLDMFPQTEHVELLASLRAAP